MMMTVEKEEGGIVIEQQSLQSPLSQNAWVCVNFLFI